MSPDLPELEWAEEVYEAQDHSFMKRSRSLEQLLQLTEPLIMNSVRTYETTGPVYSFM